MSPTAHIIQTRSGRWQVRYRLGGRETNVLSAGTFHTLRAARERRALVEQELGSGRDPRTLLEAMSHPPERVTIEEAARLWQRSRIDIAPNTANVHRKSLRHVLERFGRHAPGEITPAEVSAWVGELAGRYSPGYVRKITDALAMVLDHQGVAPNPVRDRRVRLPREERQEITPPEADAVERVLGAMAARYRLSALVLEATAMRVGELESLTWGDLDYQGVIAPPLPLVAWLGPANRAARWRIAVQREKKRRGRWVPVPEDVWAAIDRLVPREDRDLEARVLPWLAQANLRREIARGCKATGTPLWSPHDLRHRRVSLWHRAGVSWAQIGEWAGQRDIATTANRYTHVVLGGELDRGVWLAPRDEPVMSVEPEEAESPHG